MNITPNPQKRVYWVEPEKGCFHFFLDKKHEEQLAHHGIELIPCFLMPDKSSQSDKNLLPHKDFLNLADKTNLREVLNSELVIFDGYRPPDRALAYYRELIAHKSIYIQHGRYTSLKRVRIRFNLLRKVKYYSIFFMRLPRKFFLRRMRDIFMLSRGKEMQYLTGLIYEEVSYWHHFHRKKGLNFKTLVPISDRDLSTFSISANVSVDVLYCAQSIYEDGRCSYHAFSEFASHCITLYSRLGVSLVVKSHPRSRMNILNNLFRGLIYPLNSELPRPHYMITHNSAIAKCFLDEGITTVFVPINKEAIPDGLMQSRSAIVLDHLNELNEELHHMLVSRSISLKNLGSKPHRLDAKDTLTDAIIKSFYS